MKPGELIFSLERAGIGETAEIMLRIDALLALVTDMRNSQRDWFGGDKSREKLNEARALERAVDKALRELLSPPAEQKGLFDGKR